MRKIKLSSFTPSHYILKFPDMIINIMSYQYDSGLGSVYVIPTNAGIHTKIKKITLNVFDAVNAY
jgi:hypothetical protein